MYNNYYNNIMVPYYTHVIHYHSILVVCNIKVLPYLIVSVGAQVCRTSVDCRTGDQVIDGVTTIEQCCLDTTSGLAFNIGEICTPCIGT